MWSDFKGQLQIGSTLCLSNCNSDEYFNPMIAKADTKQSAKEMLVCFELGISKKLSLTVANKFGAESLLLIFIVSTLTTAEFRSKVYERVL